MTVDQQIAEIKTHMPEVYKSIQAKAAEVGKVAYAYVRRGLRGEPNCFYAFERGRVVGTPFSVTDIQSVVAMHMVTFGCSSCLIWPELAAPTAASIGTASLPSPPVGTPGAESRAGNSTPAPAPVAGSGKSERKGEQPGVCR